METLVNEVKAKVARCGSPDWGASPDALIGMQRELQAAIADLDPIERWLKGEIRNEPSSTMLREQYLETLWKAIDHLHARRRYGEALQLWALARLSSTTRSAEVIALARAVANAVSAGSAFPYHPELAYRAVLLGVEALFRLGGADAVQFPELYGVFEVLRIDWSQPGAALEMQARIQQLKELTPVKRYLPSAVTANLDFWYAMGQWRSLSKSNAVVRQQFTELVKQCPDKDVYRWCMLRVRYESEPTDRGAAIAMERALWPAAHNDDIALLADFFEALLRAEQLAQLRPHAGGNRHNLPPQVRKKRQVRAILRNPPRVVLESRALSEHLSPVLKAMNVEIPVTTG
jgi:hypothetical protein